MMKRRQAIRNIFVATGAAMISIAGFKFYKLNKTPDLSFLSSQKSLIAELAETIIPATDTPGAKDVFVEDFILKMLTHCTDPKEQNSFVAGLKEVQEYSLKHYQHPFQECSLDERNEVLRFFEKDEIISNRIVKKIRVKLIGEKFFYQLRNLTVIGYCTSMEGATKGLAYDYVPINYQACMPLSPGQKAWATK